MESLHILITIKEAFFPMGCGLFSGGGMFVSTDE